MTDKIAIITGRSRGLGRKRRHQPRASRCRHRLHLSRKLHAYRPASYDHRDGF